MQKLIGLIFLVLFAASVFAADTNAPVLYDTNADSPAAVCTMEYAPVCGEIQVQCVKAPCNPVVLTYGNKCMATAAGAKILYEGECKVEKCIDSDNGIDYYTKGFITGYHRSGSKVQSYDQCEGNTLTEWYCESGYVQDQLKKDCSAGCRDGACLEEPSTPEQMCGTMDYSKAKSIASNSCGTLTDEYYCNESTNTWWFKLNMEMTGCNPHCVVDTKSGKAEINYMCTGAIPETPVTDETNCMCTREYNPICGKIKVCTTNCSLVSPNSSVKPACESKCYYEQRTFGNKCVADCEGAEIVYSGECQSDCPKYEMPECSNGKIILDYDDRGCSKPKCVEARTEHYTNAYWKCSNGKEFKKEEKCMPYSYWKNLARTTCAEYSSKDCTSYTKPVTSYSTGNFLLDTIKPAQTTTIVDINETTCVGSEVYVTDFEVFGQCDPQCKSYENSSGCKVVKCEDGTVTEYCNQSCPSQDYNEIRAIKDKCYSHNGQIVVKTDDKGCSEYTCSFSTDANSTVTCSSVEEIPKERYYYCEENGGKVVARTNEQGCLTFFECVMPPKDYDSNKIDSALISDQTKLLELALKLETLKMELQKVADKIQSISEYYSASSDSNSADKFERAVEIINTAISKIDSAKQLIKENVDSFDEEKAIQVREIIKTIREEKLKEVLLILLE